MFIKWPEFTVQLLLFIFLFHFIQWLFKKIDFKCIHDVGMYIKFVIEPRGGLIIVHDSARTCFLECDF